VDYQKDFIIDFARRTRSNLEYIEKAQERGESVFEVTQLANSLLGLLVFPREQYMSRIPDTPLTVLIEQGWPEITTTHGGLKEDTLKQLMRMLRNGIAHCNVEFTADDRSQITGLRIWNTKGHSKTWEVTLTVADLRAIAFKFVELLAEDTESSSSESPSEALVHRQGGST
jgi:hypothetical protein